MNSDNILTPIIKDELSIPEITSIPNNKTQDNLDLKLKDVIISKDSISYDSVFREDANDKIPILNKDYTEINDKPEIIEVCTIIDPTNTHDKVIEESRNNDTTITTDDQSVISYRWNYERMPSLITRTMAIPVTSNQADDNIFTKGCKWSPDGTCLLTCSEDHTLRLYNTPYDLYDPTYPVEKHSLPDMPCVLKYKASGTIYDYCWSPSMNSGDPSTCSLICTAKQSPIHMVDAFTGQLKCSFRGFDAMDEPTPAYSVSFTKDSSRLVAGYNSELRIFDVEKPGRDCTTRKTNSKKSPGQKGILSCLDTSGVDLELIAVGSYLKTVALYDLRRKGMAAMFNGQVGGVTQVLFSTDGRRLYSGGRKDSEIICWDLRNYGRVLYTMRRRVSTNQRIYFDIDSSQESIWSASHDGRPLCFPVPSSEDNESVLLDEAERVVDPSLTWLASSDCVNGISCHPYMPIVATSCGQRIISSPYLDLCSAVDVEDPSSGSEREVDSDDENAAKRRKLPDNSVILWFCGHSDEMKAEETLFT